MNADERLTIIFEGMWLQELSRDLEALAEAPDAVALRTMFNTLTKGG